MFKLLGAHLSAMDRESPWGGPHSQNDVCFAPSLTQRCMGLPPLVVWRFSPSGESNFYTNTPLYSPYTRKHHPIHHAHIHNHTRTHTHFTHQTHHDTHAHTHTALHAPHTKQIHCTDRTTLTCTHTHTINTTPHTQRTQTPTHYHTASNTTTHIHPHHNLTNTHTTNTAHSDITQHKHTAPSNAHTCTTQQTAPNITHTYTTQHTTQSHQTKPTTHKVHHTKHYLTTQQHTQHTPNPTPTHNTTILTKKQHERTCYTHTPLTSLHTHTTHRSNTHTTHRSNTYTITHPNLHKNTNTTRTPPHTNTTKYTHTTPPKSNHRTNQNPPGYAGGAARAAARPQNPQSPLGDAGGAARASVRPFLVSKTLTPTLGAQWETTPNTPTCPTAHRTSPNTPNPLLQQKSAERLLQERQARHTKWVERELNKIEASKTKEMEALLAKSAKRQERKRSRVDSPSPPESPNTTQVSTETSATPVDPNKGSSSKPPPAPPAQAPADMWDDVYEDEIQHGVLTDIEIAQAATSVFGSFRLRTTSQPATPPLSMLLKQADIPVESLSWDHPTSSLIVMLRRNGDLNLRDKVTGLTEEFLRMGLTLILPGSMETMSDTTGQGVQSERLYTLVIEKCGRLLPTKEEVATAAGVTIFNFRTPQGTNKVFFEVADRAKAIELADATAILAGNTAYFISEALNNYPVESTTILANVRLDLSEGQIYAIIAQWIEHTNKLIHWGWRTKAAQGPPESAPPEPSLLPTPTNVRRILRTGCKFTGLALVETNSAMLTSALRSVTATSRLKLNNPTLGPLRSSSLADHLTALRKHSKDRKGESHTHPLPHLTFPMQGRNQPHHRPQWPRDLRSLRLSSLPKHQLKHLLNLSQPQVTPPLPPVTRKLRKARTHPPHKPLTSMQVERRSRLRATALEAFKNICNFLLTLCKKNKIICNIGSLTRTTLTTTPHAHSHSRKLARGLGFNWELWTQLLGPHYVVPRDSLRTQHACSQKRKHTPKRKHKRDVQQHAPPHATPEHTQTTHQNLHTHLRVGSINVCGALRNKVPYINNKYLTPTPRQVQILALLETKTAVEDTNWLKSAFPGYQVLVAGDQKNKTWAEYRKAQEALITHPDPRADDHLASINEYKCQMSGGVVLLIRKDLARYFEQVFLLPGTNTISLQTFTPNSPTPTFMHFLYVPGDLHGKAFWEGARKALKPLTSATHWLMGDLNCYISSRDSRPGQITAPKPLRRLIKELDLCDTWRHFLPENASQFTPTFGRPNKASAIGCVQSRIDYILGPNSHLPTVLDCEIAPFNVSISADHAMVHLVVDITMSIKDHTPPPPTPKIKTYTIPESFFSEKWKAYTGALTLALSSSYWERVSTQHLTEEEALSAYTSLTKTLDLVATKTLGVANRKIGSSKNAFEDTGDFQHLNKVCSILLNCILAAPNTRWPNIPKVYAKLPKLIDTPYQTPLLSGPFATEEEFGDQLALVHDACQASLKLANKNLKRAHQAHTSSFINKRVKEIRELRNSPKPARFFKKCHPLKIYPNQSLYTAKETSTSRGTPTTQEHTKPHDVLRIVAKCWEGIMSSKMEEPTRLSTEPDYLTRNHKLVAARAKILGKDDALCSRFTPKEVELALANLANNKQPGPDRRPNELLKMASSETICPILASIFSTFVDSGTIPQEWHQSNIFLIYKSGDAADPNNYRPIALLNTLNKTFASLVNKRLSDFLEANSVLSDMQGGFRPGRTTFTKIWTLVQSIEHANTNHNNIHIAYIDLKKAYDSVEHWGLRKVLRDYGFSAQFTTLIMAMCVNNTSQIITPYGLTRDIKITRGVRQGCPLSPTLFILFLNPLLHKLESCNYGYKVGKTAIPGGAFADDIVLSSSTHWNLRSQFNICASFFKCFALEMAIDGRDKTIYTHTNPIHRPLMHPYLGKEVPHINPSESYKYLGVHINLRLDWERQTRASNRTFHMYAGYLNRKCFTASQAAEVFNLVVFPTITYRMGIVTFPPEQVAKWDNKVVKVMERKLKCNRFLGFINWSLPSYMGGLNLFRLKDLQVTNSAAVYLNYSANGSDCYATALTTPNFSTSGTVAKIQQSLEASKLEITPNPAHTIPNYEKLCKHYTSGVVEAKLTKAKCLITDLVGPSNRLTHLFLLQDRIPGWTLANHRALQELVCSPGTDRVLPHITTLKEAPESSDLLRVEDREDLLFWDPEYNAVEVFVDESLAEGKASFGTFFAPNHPWNLGSRTTNRQDLQASTCQGIIYALKKLPLDTNVNFYIDRESALKVLWQLPLPPRVQHKTQGVALFNQIHSLVTQRTGTTNFKQVYSHLEIDGATSPERAEKVTKHRLALIAQYGEARTARLIEGNTQADRLADQGLNAPDLKCPPTTTFNPKYILTPCSKKVSTPILDTFRPSIKDMLRVSLQKKVVSNKADYDPWVSRTDIQKDCWKLLKSVKPEDEEIKLHFNRLLHNTLPTKAKLYPRIAKEQAKYPPTSVAPRFWTDRYPYIKDNLCTFCGAVPETMDHLHACGSPTVTNVRTTLVRQLKGESNKHPNWMIHSPNASNSNPASLPICYGSRGLIPKSPDLPGAAAVQALVLEASLKIWRMRCRRLFTIQVPRTSIPNP